MWFDGRRQPNTIYVANTSRGKDSTAMLRAIQLMGWPLDAIVAVDIWATKTIPAELPPMVAFKDEYDKKVFEWFGVPVTRLCATKCAERERDCHTRISSTEKSTLQSTEDTSMDSQEQSAGGVSHLKTRLKEADMSSRLTYEEIFYRKITPRHQREREREEMRQRVSRKRPNLRIPSNQGSMVQLEPQAICTTGFPSQMCRWCTGDLKRSATRNLAGKLMGSRQGGRTGATATSRQGSSTSLFYRAPERGAKNKYRSLHRNCSRRTNQN